MIWDWIARKGSEHPNAARRITAALVLILLFYWAVGWVGSFLADQGRDACETQNASRLASLREVTGKRSDALVREAIFKERGDDNLAQVEHEEVEVFNKRISDLIATAERTGHQVIEGSVTISCFEEWPKPIPWFEGS